MKSTPKEKLDEIMKSIEKELESSSKRLKIMPIIIGTMFGGVAMQIFGIFTATELLTKLGMLIFLAAVIATFYLQPKISRSLGKTEGMMEVLSTIGEIDKEKYEKTISSE